jgi:hypothetical protein
MLRSFTKEGVVVDNGFVVLILIDKFTFPQRATHHFVVFMCEGRLDIYGFEATYTG